VKLEVEDSTTYKLSWKFLGADPDFRVDVGIKGKGWMVSRDKDLDTTDGEFSATFENMNPAVSYAFRVQTKGSGNTKNSRWSITAYKLAENSKPPRQRVTLIPLSSGIKLKWEQDPAWAGGVEPTHFDIDVGIKGSGWGSVGTPQDRRVQVPAMEATIDGLTTNTEYIFRLRARNDNGTSSTSDDKIGSWSMKRSAVEGVATVPATVSADQIDISQEGSTKVRLGYREPKDGGSPLDGHEGEYDTDANFTNPTEFEPFNIQGVGMDDVWRTEIEGLTANTTYYFRVRASNAIGVCSLDGPAKVHYPGQFSERGIGDGRGSQH